MCYTMNIPRLDIRKSRTEKPAIKDLLGGVWGHKGGSLSYTWGLRALNHVQSRTKNKVFDLKVIENKIVSIFGMCFSESWHFPFILCHFSRFARMHSQERTGKLLLPIHASCKVLLGNQIAVLHLHHMWGLGYCLWNRLVMVCYSQKTSKQPAWFCHWIFALV